MPPFETTADLPPFSEATSALPTQRLFGVPIHALTMDEVVGVVDETIRRRGRLLVGVVNAAKMVNMRQDRALSDSVLSSNLILADGMAVVWACWLLRRPVPERVPGIDLMQHLLARSREKGYRVYCLGATQEVLSKAIGEMRRHFPGINIAGEHHGYFTAAEEPAIAEDIRNSRSDVLLVAMSSPKKERFLAKWSSVLNVPVCHGVGGSFDVMAGKVRRAPVIWQRLGMEWLYRVLQEPRRMWRRYLVTNVVFCTLLVRELISPDSTR